MRLLRHPRAALSLAAFLLGLPLAVPDARASRAETVALFNPAAFETPESVQFDRHGKAYASLAMTGEVRTSRWASPASRGR